MKYRSLSALLAASVSTLGLGAQTAAISLQNTVDGFVEVPYSPAVVPQGGITVEAWVTYDGSTIGPNWRYPTIVRQNRNAGQESFFLRVEAGNSGATSIRWLVNVNSVVDVYWSFVPGQLTTWTHLAGTWDGTTARLFVNGAEVGSRTGSGALRDQGDVLRIGKGSDVGTPMEVWNGSIDELRIWPFARTGAEITSTMNYSLIGVPGDVSTWNFDNNTQDTSAGRHATSTGAVSYTAGVPALPVLPFPGASVGAGTAGCRGALRAAPAGMPQAGNAGFALVAPLGVAGAPAICAISTNTAPLAFPLLGVDIWVDVGLLQGGFAATVDNLGTMRLPLPVPATAAGIQLAGQFFQLDPCGPQGLTASDALGVVIIP